jgi:hypothetical protein
LVARSLVQVLLALQFTLNGCGTNSRWCRTRLPPVHMRRRSGSAGGSSTTRTSHAPCLWPSLLSRSILCGMHREPRVRLAAVVLLPRRWRPPRRADGGGGSCSAAASLPRHGGSPWTRYRNGYAPFSRLISPLTGRILDRIEPVAGASDPRQHVRATRAIRTPIRVCASVLPQPGSPTTPQLVETQSSLPTLDAPAGCCPTSSYLRPIRCVPL